jgi:hypothetical protein
MPVDRGADRYLATSSSTSKLSAVHLWRATRDVAVMVPTSPTVVGRLELLQYVAPAMLGSYLGLWGFSKLSATSRAAPHQSTRASKRLVRRRWTWRAPRCATKRTAAGEDVDKYLI